MGINVKSLCSGLLREFLPSLLLLLGTQSPQNLSCDVLT